VQEKEKEEENDDNPEENPGEEEEMRYAPVDSKLRTTPGGNDERERRG